MLILSGCARPGAALVRGNRHGLCQFSRQSPGASSWPGRHTQDSAGVGAAQDPGGHRPRLQGQGCWEKDVWLVGNGSWGAPQERRQEEGTRKAFSWGKEELGGERMETQARRAAQTHSLQGGEPGPLLSSLPALVPECGRCTAPARSVHWANVPGRE